MAFPGRPVAFRDHKQEWWYTRRPAEVEAEACALVRRWEGRHGARAGCVFPPELLVSEVGCRLEYFEDADRERHGLPPDVIGALKVRERLILVFHPIDVVGREWHTVGEEVGHMVLHARDAVALEQLGLGLEVSASKSAKRTCFYRTAGEKYVDQEREPPYMTTEAGFFSACVQMPADRYGPVAEACLIKALRAAWPRGRPMEWDGRLEMARQQVPLIRERGWSAWQCSKEMPGVFDWDIIEGALRSLEAEHGGQVSKQAQRRRMTELGLVVDAAQHLKGEQGDDLLPYFEFLLVGERLTEQLSRA